MPVCENNYCKQTVLWWHFKVFQKRHRSSARSTESKVVENTERMSTKATGKVFTFRFTPFHSTTCAALVIRYECLVSFLFFVCFHPAMCFFLSRLCWCALSPLSAQMVRGGEEAALFCMHSKRPTHSRTKDWDNPASRIRRLSRAQITDSPREHVWGAHDDCNDNNSKAHEFKIASANVCDYCILYYRLSLLYSFPDVWHLAVV